MQRRGLLWLSLALNLALAAGLTWVWRQYKEFPSANTATATVNVVTRDRVIPVVRRQFFTWAELESTNYDTYVANLRDISCPEETIHDIILADVNKLYAERMANEDQSPEHLAALDDERTALLTRLLGPDWNASERKTGFAFSKVAFTDPLLDNLEPDTRAHVQEILTRWSQQAVADPQAAAVLEQNIRLELAAVLSPAQLEELLSRYSANAINLNKRLAELKYFKATPAEFRQLFRATDEIDLELRLLGNDTDPATVSQRNMLLHERELAIQTALGSQRYTEYVRLQDPAYREAIAAAQNTSDPQQAASTIYAINQEAALQKAIIQVDPTLTDTQKVIAEKQAELERLKAQTEAQGYAAEPPPLPPAMVTVNQPYLLNTGDTLNSLAQRFQTTPNAIQAANPSLNFTAIKPGETVYIPMQVPAQ